MHVSHASGVCRKDEQWLLFALSPQTLEHAVPIFRSLNVAFLREKKKVLRRTLLLKWLHSSITEGLALDGMETTLLGGAAEGS